MNWLCRLALMVFSLSVFAAPEKDEWTFWAASDELSELTISHELWNELLHLYVLNDPKSEIIRFDYVRVSADDKRKLQQYIESLALVDVRSHNKQEQMSYWINLYNALTVQVVLKYPGKNSILEMGGTFFSRGPWNDVVITVDQQDLTLNDIEHRILRPIFNDHRVHFALNCASLGCPDLATNAYRSSNLEVMLAKGEVVYLNHRRGIRFEGEELVVSSLFDWYQDDFAANEDLLRSYLAKHLEAKMAEKVMQYEGEISYAYNWTLNEPAAQAH